MRKRSAIILLLVLVVLAGLPYGFGVLAERTFNANVERGRQSAGLTVKSSRFHRGWLASTAEVVFAAPGAAGELRTTHQISHGPLSLSHLLDGDMRFAVVQAIVRSRGQLHDAQGAALPLPAISAETVVGLDGHGETVLSLPDVASERHGELRGASGRISFSPDLKQLKAEFRVASATLRSEPLPAGNLENVALRGVRFDSNIAQNDHGIWLGTSELQIEALTLAPLLQLRELKWITSTRPSGAVFDVMTTQSIRQLDYAGNALGELNMAVDVHRLDGKAIGQYERELSSLYQDNVPAEQAGLMVLGKTINLLSALSKTAPEIELREFRLRSPKGELRGHGKLVLDGSQIDVSQNPMLLLVALKGEAELTVPREMMKAFFARQIAADVEALKARGQISGASAEALDGDTVDRIVDEALAMYVADHEFARHFRPAGADFRITATVRRGQVFINDQLWQGGLVARQ